MAGSLERNKMSIPPYPKEKPLTMIEEIFYPSLDQIELSEITPGSAEDEERTDYEFRKSTLSSLKSIPEEKTWEPPKLKKKKKKAKHVDYSNPSPSTRRKIKRLFK